MFKKIFLLFFISVESFASSFWVPDSDTTLLFELLSNSISQLNELEELVSSTAKYTKKMQEYNELALDQMDRAKRIANFAEYHAELLTSKPQDLKELNYLVRELKTSQKYLQELIYERMGDYSSVKESEKIASKNAPKMEKKAKSYGKEEFTHRSTQVAIQERIRINTARTAHETAILNSNINLMMEDQSLIAKSIISQDAVRLEKEKERLKYIGVTK